MMIVDEKGDEILCMLFDKSDPDCSEKPPLLKGRVYYFENGDVEKDQNDFLFVSMPWTNIRQTKSMLPSFHPSKMMRVGEL